MSRSGYTDDCEHLDLYRATVERSLKGRRGQAFLRELAEALDAMPEKVLIAGELVDETGDCCAIGAVCLSRGVNHRAINCFDPVSVASAMGISRAMASEIQYMNDEWASIDETPEERWTRIRKWVDELLED